MKKIIYVSAISSLIYANTISDIEFKGLYHLSKEQALKAVDLKINDEVNIYKINDAVKNLFSYGYFDDIYVDENNGKLIFNVVEKQFIAKVNIKGTSSNDKKQIESFLSIKKGEAYNDRKIEEAKEKIILYYQSRGFYDSVVEVDTQELENNAVVLNFNINRGEIITIKKVNLIGAKKLDYSDFDPVIANKEKELLGWFWGFNDGKLYSTELPNDPARIKDEYMKKGYLDANVSNPYLEANMQTYKAELTYYISEGKRYKIEEITIENPLENEVKFNLSDLRSKKGKYINSEKIRSDIELIKTKFQDKGYALAEVYPDIAKNDADGVVRIYFRVNLGNKYNIGKVIIKGNDKSLDKVVRRELFLTEGMQFNKTDLNDSIIALRKTGYFEEVNITPKPSFTGDIDLLVDVKEKSTGSITGGVGYSTSDGFLINASVSDRNILGSGMYGGINLEKSDKDVTGKIFLNNPRIFDSKYSTGFDIYSYKRDWDTYEEYNNGLELSIGRELARFWGIGAIYNYEQSDLRKATIEMIASGEKLGKSRKSAITPYLYFDNTDDFYLPRSGIYSRAAFTYAGLGGDQKYKKFAFDFKYYKGLKEDFDTDLIFRFRTSFNKLFNYKDTPINSRLYLGGLRSVRGYESDSITPRGIGYYDTNTHTKVDKLGNGVIAYPYDKGGAISLNSSVEINFPLINKLKLRGSIFYDYGMIGEKKLNEIKRQSAGISLDWSTPMGPLVFVFSKPIDKKSGDKTNTFEFSIGSQF
ncbi:outer membrane protein assembly factor BamA [Campylobacter sp. RM9333]|uniref:outer membrane protein assembly factor BamA n=1 Tax=Campylobacter sp. RM9333 TaxID=2735731 RepID=UPI001E19F771|nr:outer membrane protein assembly factor BamA [Campylobacter sp. RM9333]